MIGRPYGETCLVRGRVLPETCCRRPTKDATRAGLGFTGRGTPRRAGSAAGRSVRRSGFRCGGQNCCQATVSPDRAMHPKPLGIDHGHSARTSCLEVGQPLPADRAGPVSSNGDRADDRSSAVQTRMVRREADQGPGDTPSGATRLDHSAGQRAPAVGRHGSPAGSGRPNHRRPQPTRRGRAMLRRRKGGIDELLVYRDGRS